MSRLISDKFKQWETECNNRFNTLKANEEELNRIFIEIYGLQDELTPEVEDKDVTVRKADLQREIKSLISYAIGCILGRYSLSIDGLTYAGGEWDDGKYPDSFRPCEYGIIPVTEDQYFEEDLYTRLVDFIRIVYGEDTLDENLAYIAKALKPDSYEIPQSIIRDYLFRGFYADHCKIYSNRPIYWMFDSGKAGGFKALIYMHRYGEHTIPTIRLDYLHELQYKYETETDRLRKSIPLCRTTADKSRITKIVTDLEKKMLECRSYDELLNHAANMRISIDLDDGVKVNYMKFQNVDGNANNNLLTVIKL